MALPNADAQSERSRLYMFTKILTLKVAQIVVQSRQGKKITHDSNTLIKFDDSPLTSNALLFNLSIPDEPEVNSDTNHVLNGEVIDALSKVLCIEILLRTSEGDEMVLELWTVKMTPGCDATTSSVSTIYYRMSVMLKSTLSISRITPAYKMSRAQHKENYKISHKIYGGPPNLDLLGDKHKNIKVSELRTPIGTIVIEVLYRTKMEILPDDKQRVYCEQLSIGNDRIMLKSDHFPCENGRRESDKKGLDLSKPLTAGAFVDTDKIKKLHDTLSQKLPPEPPMSWLLPDKETTEIKKRFLSTTGHVDITKPGCSKEMASYSAPTATKAIEVPKTINGDKCNSLMMFPFAEGSPLTELASFYNECLQARSASDEWTDIVSEISASTDSELLSQQLKMYEDAVPEFDNMVASMFSNSDHGSDN